MSSSGAYALSELRSSVKRSPAYADQVRPGALRTSSPAEIHTPVTALRLRLRRTAVAGGWG
ncbi:hypothetical protein [Streptomyces sp. NPDC019539]|uniref:hypothetical protein n=1 Tax=Streptomyces sp. NPDC019539 TaxID=3365063 RepID=UPI0037A77911